jgi:hypothetical protein
MSRIDEIRERVKTNILLRADVEYLLARVQRLELLALRVIDDLETAEKYSTKKDYCLGREDCLMPDECTIFALRRELNSEAPLQPEAAPGTTGER